MRVIYYTHMKLFHLSRRYYFLSLVFVTVLLGGCMTPGFQIGMLTGSGGANTLPEMSNNTRITLEAQTYRASAISHNRVTLTGQGAGQTRITGTLRISGNGVSLSALTIDGNVRISGNNVDLSGARITGSVQDSGQNNSW
ncbi:MAG: hypothetical protein EA383_11250 [Spirochaetaceae bacterium]|nr:MAG: hypothetical protein EA383_11250 [Spirochaetaceae bacterium]